MSRDRKKPDMEAWRRVIACAKAEGFDIEEEAIDMRTPSIIRVRATFSQDVHAPSGAPGAAMAQGTPAYENEPWKTAMRAMSAQVRRNRERRNEAQYWCELDPDQLDAVLSELELLGRERDAAIEAMQDYIAWVTQDDA